MNILLVEDDAGLVELITVNLEELGFSVRSAASGAEALAHLEKQTPDLILLDYSLPDINGKELIETLIKQQISCPPFILTTGQGDERIAVNMMKLGAMDYLVKDMLFLEKIPDVVKRVIKEIESADKLIQAEETLLRNEKRLQNIFECMSEGFSIQDVICDDSGNPIDLRFVEANPAFELQTGLKNSETLGHTLLELFPTSEKYWIERYGKVGITGEAISFEATFGPLNKFYNVNAFQTKHNQFGVLFTDINDRKVHEIELTKAKEKAEQSEERFNLAMTASKDGLFDWNLISNEIYYSPGWKVILGYKDEELANDVSVWERLSKPVYVEAAYVMQQEVINKQRDRFEIEIKMQHKDGHWVDILSRAEAVFDDKGTAIRMVGTHVDITERKQEEKILNVELKLFEYAINHSEEELLQKFLDEAEKLTGSKIGFYHYIEDDQESISLQAWSSNTLNNMCKGSGEATQHYPISKAGVWIDCIKERKPVIHNDYSSLAHKKGLPEGHAPIIRELVVPVIRGNQIMAVLGVGNKDSDYKENDVKSIQRLADVAWETVLRKQAEEKIRIAEETARINEKYYENIINNMGDPVFVKDDQSRLLLVNDAFCKIFDLSRDEIIGKTLAEDVSPEEQEHFLRIDKKVITDGEDNITEESLTIRNGKTRTISTRKTRFIDNNGKKFLVGVIRDLTEHKKTENKIRTAEKNLKNTFDLSPSIIAKADTATGKFIEVSPAVRRILGYSIQEFTSKPYLEFVHSDDRQRTKDELLEQMKDKDVGFIENRYLCKDGSYKWMAWYNTNPDKNGIITAIGSDISESKSAQLKLNQSKQLLETSQSIAKLGGWELDIATNYLFWTAETYRIHDTSPEEFNPTVDAGIGYFLPESRQIISDALKAAIENGEGYDLELETLTTKGRRIDVRTTCVVSLVDGKTVKLTGIFQDITEKKDIEDKIRATEKNLKNTFDLSPSIIAKANMNEGRFIQVNKAITKILGYSIDEFTSRAYMEFVHPDDRQSTIDIATEQLKGNDVTFFENRYLCKDGSYKWMAWHGTKPDKNGIVTSIGSDINERKTIEQEIVKTKQFYENITEGVQDGIWVTDKNDIIFYANTAVEKIAGVPREQIQGNNLLKDFPKETTGELIKFYKQAKKEKKPTWYDIKVRTLANKDTWQNGWLIPQYQNKKITGIICTIRDVTERKKAESSVRRLSTAVEQSPSIIVITDTDGKLEYVNPKFTELTGFSSAEAIGQESNILKSGEQNTVFYTDLWKIVESGKVWRGQFHNKKKNGELFWEAASISAIFNETGDIVNFIKIGEDITQQKNIEVELKIALEKALESDRLKSAFLANMSHEIRTPMNGILGFINLLNEPDLSKSEIEEYSAVINRSGERLLTTINDIIDISRIESGEMIVTKEETSINSMMDELYSFYSPETKQKGLSLILKPNTEQLTINTDSHKLHGILTNLIKNAIKFTEKGAITFGYVLENMLNEQGENTKVEFFVEDTGTGVPKDRIQAIFKRFEQADIEDTKALEGSGLGLAISQAYLEMLGGEISVESEYGKGSKFTFTIPHIKT